MKINFKTKKTEAGWLKILDNFWLKITPKWFEWLGWIIILGILTFGVKQTQNLFLKFTLNFSYAILFLYLQSVFFSLEFYGLPFVKSKKIRRGISIALSALLFYGIWSFLKKLVEEITGYI